MINLKCETVKFYAEDGYIYSGLLYRADNAYKTVVHVHGACGNFLSFTALEDVVKCYIDNNINLLTFNLKGHDCISEGNWANGRFEYVGGSIMKFDECIDDIKNAITYCRTFSDTIILQGHSMGCERVLTYQLETEDYYDTILISPSDAYALQQSYISPRTIEEQLASLKRIETNPLLLDEYGICNRGEDYIIPIFKDALISTMESYAFKLFRIDKPTDYYLPINCICCIGENDKLQMLSPQVMFDSICNKFKKFITVQLPADHEFTPGGDELGLRISRCIIENL
jgi:hypothetical protein